MKGEEMIKIWSYFINNYLLIRAIILTPLIICFAIDLIRDFIELIHKALKRRKRGK